MGRRIYKIAASLTGIVVLAVAAIAPMTVHAVADCSAGTSMNVVAHQDDDLLFMNPDILHDIQASKCVQTVYLTAGDAGAGSSWWQGREAGVKAAYAQMAGVSNTWDNTTPNVLGNTLHLSTLHDQPEVSLVFFRLPDGSDVNGTEGFASTSYQTMRKLWLGTISSLSAVDSSATYGRNELVDTLRTLMATYAPSTIRTLDYVNTYYDHPGGDGDNLDHHTAAYITREAQKGYSLVAHTLKSYDGYEISAQSANVAGTDLTDSQDAFFTYNAVGNGANCTGTTVVSSSTPAAGECNDQNLLDWLERQYVLDTQSGNTPWHMETMEGDSGSLSGASGDIGNTPAAVEFGGTLYAFYYDAANGNLKYAKNSSQSSPSWSFATLDGAGSSGTINANVGITPTAVVYDNKIHIFYYDASNGNLRHGWSSDGSNWSFNNHDGDTGSIGGLNSNLGQNPVVLVSGSSLQLFYYDSGNGNLRHSWSNDGVSWYAENLDGDSGSISGYNANVGDAISATVYGSTLQLFYYDATAGDLRHAWADSGGWHFESLDGSGGGSGRVSASVGSSSSTTVQGSTIHVFYYDSTSGNLRHMWSSPSAGWQAENLAGDNNAVIRYDGDVGLMPTSVVNGSSLEVFAYDASQGDLMRIWDSGSGWQEEHMDGNGTTPLGGLNAVVGYDPVAVNFGSYLHVFYYDLTNGNLRHVNP